MKITAPYRVWGRKMGLEVGTVLGYDNFRRPGEWLLEAWRVYTGKQQGHCFGLPRSSWILWFLGAAEKLGSEAQPRSHSSHQSHTRMCL